MSDRPTPDEIGEQARLVGEALTRHDRAIAAWRHASTEKDEAWAHLRVERARLQEMVDTVAPPPLESTEADDG